VATPLHKSFSSAENFQEASRMKNLCRVFFTMLAGLTLVVAVWALAPATTNEAALLSLSASQDAAQQQSVSGKIASVEKNSFTLTVGQSQTSNEKNDLQLDPASPRTMTFQLDKNTTIEGSLKVGANADVTYRQERGVNVAISVHVTP
jgi:hypothetical protein